MMNENSFGADDKSLAEVIESKTKRLGEGESTGWDNERRLTIREVVAELWNLGVETRGLKVTSQLVSFEGVPLLLHFRIPGNITGYYYELKGQHGKIGTAVTTLGSIDYAGPDSDELDYPASIPQVLAECQNGVWVKK